MNRIYLFCLHLVLTICLTCLPCCLDALFFVFVSCMWSCWSLFRCHLWTISSTFCHLTRIQPSLPLRWLIRIEFCACSWVVLIDVLWSIGREINFNLGANLISPFKHSLFPFSYQSHILWFILCWVRPTPTSKLERKSTFFRDSTSIMQGPTLGGYFNVWQGWW